MPLSLKAYVGIHHLFFSVNFLYFLEKNFRDHEKMRMVVYILRNKTDFITVEIAINNSRIVKFSGNIKIVGCYHPI